MSDDSTTCSQIKFSWTTWSTFNLDCFADIKAPLGHPECLSGPRVSVDLPSKEEIANYFHQIHPSVGGTLSAITLGALPPRWGLDDNTCLGLDPCLCRNASQIRTGGISGSAGFSEQPQRTGVSVALVLCESRLRSDVIAKLNSLVRGGRASSLTATHHGGRGVWCGRLSGTHKHKMCRILKTGSL